VLSKAPFSAEKLGVLEKAAADLGFNVLLAPNHPPETKLLQSITESRDIAVLNRAANADYLDLTVPTDNRPFFFNQLRFSDIPEVTQRALDRTLGGGVRRGNLTASAVLILILIISIVAVITTILVPLRAAARACPRNLVLVGSLYFSLIGMGFMLAEIALLERFSIYLGHPIYSLGVCLFSLILASGLGSLTSDWFKLDTRPKLLIWGGIVAAYLMVMALLLPAIFQATTDQERMIRIGVSLLAIMPLGFLLGFAFPTGMRLVETIDRQPTPWFWGINGATGVLASVLGVMFSMALGIHVTLTISAICYLLLIPTGFALLRLARVKKR
jgi:hypothetical protein